MTRDSLNTSPIAIVGVGGVFPSFSPSTMPSSPEGLWSMIEQGRSAFREVPPGRWLLNPDECCGGEAGVPDQVVSRHGCFVEPFSFDPTGLDVPDFIGELDPLFHITLEAGRQAYQSAQVASIDPTRIGVVLGNIALPTEKSALLADEYLGRTFAEKCVDRGAWSVDREKQVGVFLTDRGPRTTDVAVHRRVAGYPARLLAQALRLRGGAFTLDAACASSLYAIKLAADELIAGRADAMLAGGVSRPDCLYTQMGFSQLRALSGQGRSIPFDARGDGLIVGEGAGIFVLKRLDDALRAGDRIWAVLAGAGLSNDVSGGLLAPASEGQLRAMRRAYAEAGWSPSDVDFIECHATGTPVGDRIEYQSLRTLWDESSWRTGQCVLGSVKGTVGHLLTAAGAAGLVKVLYSLKTATLPAQPEWHTPAPGIDLEDSPFQVLSTSRPWPRREGRPRRAAISGFGFGGINAHLLLEEYTPRRASVSLAPSITGQAGRLPCEPIAVVGMEARFGPWQSLEALTARIFGKDDRSPLPPRRWWGVEQSAWFREQGLAPSDFGGFYIDRIEVAARRYRIPPRELEEMLPQQLLMLETVADLLENVDLSDEVRLRTGAFIGLELDLNTTNFHFRWSMAPLARRWLARKGISLSPEDEARWIGDLRDAAGPALNANKTMGALGSIVASRIAREFRLGGPSFTVADEENSGLHALELAVRALQQGELDQAVVGAVDLAGDVRAALASGATPVGEGACAIRLKRLDDARRDGDAIHAVIEEVRAESASLPAGTWDVTADVGHVGAASGLASLIKACVCLDRRMLSDPPRYWLHDRAGGPRSVVVRGAQVRSALDESRAEPVANAPGSDALEEGLFLIEGDTDSALLQALDELAPHLDDMPGASVDELARAWLKRRPPRPDALRASAMVARDREQLRELVEGARALIGNPQSAIRNPMSPALRDRIFYSPEPLGKSAEVAFVFPGSGNDFPRMGMDLSAAWPGVLGRQEEENDRLRSQFVADAFWDETRPAPVVDRIQAQVALGTLVADLLQHLGVRPHAAIGCSLGESTALFAMRAWTDRDGMLASLQSSSLFREDLTGAYNAVRRAWRLADDKPVRWTAGIVSARAEDVRRVLANEPRVYLLLIHTPSECVLGGDTDTVGRVVAELGCTMTPLSHPQSVHCPVVQEVADAYLSLHALPTTPPPDIRFYSAALGRAYEVTRESAANAILGQALDTLDFPRLIERAYQDGVRLFVEIGPGVSCSRMIAAILADRPHRVRSACHQGVNGVSAILRVLAQLAAERVPIDMHALYPPTPDAKLKQPAPPVVTIRPGGEPFAPPAIPVGQASRFPVLNKQPGETFAPRQPAERDAYATGLLAQTVATELARGEAHSAYFRFTASVRENLEQLILLQTHLFQDGRTMPVAPVSDALMPREKCLAFAVGSIADVLGSEYAEVDRFPTRVRLPDEPLMLVDRIVQVEGEPRSLGSGRVVTEHDIHAGAWYLDGGVIPTCIAVEAGQADLFLSAYLGIDFETRGLAVYRLLDAVVTFHRSLPGPGQTIRYDIHIDHFFRQAQTYLFRFRFEATVDGEPLLTMTNGCAGFFTERELATGRGIVRTELDRRTAQGVEPDEDDLVPPFEREAYDDRQVDALRAGDLETAFGPSFRGRALGEGFRLPGGRMRLVHRVPLIERRGGRFGVGLIRGEADIHPDDWFLTCHFVDDQVMPGTLMYECCLHTLRIFLLRLGWFAEGDVVCEPVPGVASQLKCRGQVTATTRRVTYEITLKERGYRPEPYVICDALMYADDRPIVEIGNMSLRLRGLRIADCRTELVPFTRRTELVPFSPADKEHERNKFRSTLSTPQFGTDRILAFAIGKPSEAFGEPYRIFDEGRVIARLPGPPYQFLDRIVAIDAEPWKMVAGGSIEAEYDVPADAWYFEADRQPVMPFAVLLEVALQPCGWLAAYLGSALTSEIDLSFRNLGGDAVLFRPVGRDAGTLTTSVKITDVATSGGMIIQKYTFSVRQGDEAVYEGNTVFGFFAREALARQVGLRDVRPWEPSAEDRDAGRSFPYPRGEGFPDDRWRMVDRIDCYLPQGGPHGLGWIEASIEVDPSAWFFEAHFYQDPVWPGSLGLEALVQLIRFHAERRWGKEESCYTLTKQHSWLYRGQVIPTNKRVRVLAEVKRCSDEFQEIVADGWLIVDGRLIYQMRDFCLSRSRFPTTTSPWLH